MIKKHNLTKLKMMGLQKSQGFPQVLKTRIRDQQGSIKNGQKNIIKSDEEFLKKWFSPYLCPNLVSAVHDESMTSRNELSTERVE